MVSMGLCLCSILQGQMPSPTLLSQYRLMEFMDVAKGVWYVFLLVSPLPHSPLTYTHIHVCMLAQTHTHTHTHTHAHTSLHPHSQGNMRLLFETLQKHEVRLPSVCLPSAHPSVRPFVCPSFCSQRCTYMYKMYIHVQCN